MPYTTMNNYNWLFNANATTTALDNHLITNNWIPEMQNGSFYTSSHLPTTTSQMPLGNTAPQQVSPRRLPEMQNALPLPMQTFLAQNDYQLFKSTIESMSAITVPSTTERTTDTTSTTSDSPQAFSTSDYAAPSSHTSMSQASISVPPTRKERPHSCSRTDQTPIHSFHPCSFSRNVPRLSESIRERIIGVIQGAGTRTPDGTPLTQDHPLLSLASLQSWFELFWTRFNGVYPLIHQATFNPEETQTLHLLAMLVLGATYGDKNAHRLAVCIHDIMRPQIFQHDHFSATPTLWMLQTILLVECFGKSRAGSKQHDMSHLFHGLLINLIRRSDCQTVSQPEFSNSSDDLDTQWRTAMGIESRKRLALLCFMWDTQHAVLFSQSLCMSSFELRTTLPCGPSVWEAETAQEWQHYNSREPAQRLFLPILKAYMSPSTPTQSNHNLNALSRLLILHGLISVSWDMKRRDDTSLGCGNLTGADNWRERLGASYDLWRADFDAYCLNISSSMNKPNYSKNPNIRADFQHFTTSTLSIYHAAHISLNVEVIDLQIYAGARHIIGRPVSPNDYERSRRKLRDWTQQGRTSGAVSPSCKAVWHAAHLLRDGIANLDNFANNAFHYPWCLYLATLVLWSFHAGSRDERPANRRTNSTTSGGAGMDHDGTDDDGLSTAFSFEDSGVWDPNAEMNALVSGMTSSVPDVLWRLAGRYSTKGLVTVMAQHLGNVRWAVIHEGMKVLKGLTARRQDRSPHSV